MLLIKFTSYYIKIQITTKNRILRSPGFHCINLIAIINIFELECCMLTWLLILKFDYMYKCTAAELDLTCYLYFREDIHKPVLIFIIIESTCKMDVHCVLK